MKFIAEFCQNHNGSMSLLQELIHSAAEAGASYGKIQTIFSENLTYRSRFEKRKNDGKSMIRPYKDEYERLQQLDLTWEKQNKFIEECLKFDLKPMTTVFTRGDVERVVAMEWNAFKLASYDCGSLPLIKDLVDSSKKLYISTGASYDEEVKRTADYLANVGHEFTFLHCVTIYPTPLDHLNLARMDWLRQYSVDVGFSDHSLVARDGIIASQAAVHLGADLIERHYTCLPSDKTKDGPVSIGETELKELVEFSFLQKEDQRKILLSKDISWEQMLGTQRRAMTEEELRNRDYYRGRFATKVESGKYIYNWDD